jgi:hypothetical protein
MPRIARALQIDGSEHRRLEGLGPKRTRMAFVDDGASRLSQDAQAGN